MPSSYLLGIDPGLSGGACFLDLDSPDQIRYVAFEDTGKAIHDADVLHVEAILEEDDEILACAIENPPLVVSGRGVPQIASRLGKLRESYGFWRGVLRSDDYPMHLIAPQTWQAMYGLPKDSDKRTLAHAACNLYPELERVKSKTLLAVCDAILICNFVYRHNYA